ncbi:MAG: DUF4258 domain-containing protein [Nitrospirae bacterium]|nr:DUF4258 domain-containing protein [Nitrospirota bacterium]
MERDILRRALDSDSYEWRKHALQRMAQRSISQPEVVSILRDGEIIEEYPESKPFPSALFLGRPAGRGLHVVAALDSAAPWAYIVTVYEPDIEHFEADLRTRRKR